MFYITSFIKALLLFHTKQEYGALFPSPLTSDVYIMHNSDDSNRAQIPVAEPLLLLLNYVFFLFFSFTLNFLPEKG